MATVLQSEKANAAEAMSLCFNAYWRQQAGDHPAAQALFARAVALAPDDPAIRDRGRR